MRTGWRLVTPAASPALNLSFVKKHLEVAHALDDVLISAFIGAAARYIENWNYEVIAKTWDMLIDGFPNASEAILVWKRPVTSVASVSYFDSNDNLQLMGASTYRIAAGSHPARILPVSSWPSTRNGAESVEVRLTAGYEPEASPPTPLPEDLIAAMLLTIGHLYANREGVVVQQGVVSIELPIGIKDLIDAILGPQLVF